MNLRTAFLLAAGISLAARALGAEAPRVDRASITFLLGDDEDPTRAMYRLAGRYFRENPQERTNHLVEDVRSLRDAIECLRRLHPSDGSPWGRINLVVHGGASGVLDVPVLPGEAGATAERLEGHLADGTLKPLPDDIVDEATVIRLHGCSVGQAPRLLKALSKAFGGSDARRPLVKAAKYFTCFQSAHPASGPVSRFLCEAWDLYFRPGARPSPTELAKRFHRRFPGANLDIERALACGVSHQTGDVFSYETPASYTWTALYPQADLVPAFQGRPQLQAWLLGNEAFTRRFRSTRLPFTDFHWEASATRTAWERQEWPALEIRGLARVIHVLRALNQNPKVGEPSGEEWDDERLYASTR